MSAVDRLEGRCHCGNISLVLETSKPPPELEIRACGCSFCRRHGANTTTDPGGRVLLAVRDEAKLGRYRFGLRTADYLVCRECGVYVGAIATDGAAFFATLNVNAFDERSLFEGRAAAPVSYEGETEAARRERRRRRWTPAELTVLHRH